MDKHTAYFNIIEALPQSGCVVCRLGNEVERKYIRDLLYSKTTAIKPRAELRDARGFCLYHASQLNEIGHALGVSIVYQDILMTVRDILTAPTAKQATGRRGRAKLAGQLHPQQDCPACLYRADLESVYVETLLDHLTDKTFAAKLRAASPLCLTHLCHAILTISSATQFEMLRSIQVEDWQALIDDLGEFIRKNDYRFQHEPVGKEGRAWLRALDAIAGTRTVK